MNAIAKAIRFIVYSNIFMALSATAYTARTSLLLYGNNGRLEVAIIVFSATLLFYCFHRINKTKFITLAEGEEVRNSWMHSHKAIYYILIAISSITLSIELFYVPFNAWLIIFPVGLLGLGYTFPVIPGKKGWKRLRDIYWLKTFWIAFAFSSFTTFLPVLSVGSVSSLLDSRVVFSFLRSFLFVFAICIPFDIRDMDIDLLKGIHTLPVIAGVRTSISISIVLLLIFILLICVQSFYFALPPKEAYPLLISAILTIILLPLTTVKRPPLFFPLLFDGAMLLQWILVSAFMQAL